MAYAFEALQTEIQETINLWEKAWKNTQASNGSRVDISLPLREDLLHVLRQVRLKIHPLAGARWVKPNVLACSQSDKVSPRACLSAIHKHLLHPTVSQAATHGLSQHHLGHVAHTNAQYRRLTVRSKNCSSPVKARSEPRTINPVVSL